MLHLIPVLLSEDTPSTGRTHFCPASRASIPESACKSLTASYQQNRQYCCSTHCQSPWRLCLRCVVQGYTGEDACTVDLQTGWCRFHSANGADAVRQKDYHQTSAAYSDSNPMRRVAQEAHRIPGSRARTGGEMLLPHTGGGRHKVTAPPRVIPIDIHDVARKIRTLPQEQQRKLAAQLGRFPTKSMEEISRELRIKRSSLDSLFRHLYNNLGMPGRQYSVAEKRDIVYRAWQLEPPAE